MISSQSYDYELQNVKYNNLLYKQCPAPGNQYLIPLCGYIRSILKLLG